MARQREPRHPARMMTTGAALGDRTPRPPPRRGRWLGWASLILPSALLLVPFFFAPLAIMLVYSFYRFVPGGRQEPAFILDNYWRFVSDPFYRSILGDTLLMGAAVTGLALLLSYPLAYTLARSRSRWKGLLTVIVLIPLMTSVVVRSYGWMILLANNGVVNALLAALQLPPTQLMFNFTGTIIGLTEVLMPFMILTLSGVIQQIDPDLEDSVRSLGGSSWHVFRDVILPLSLPGIAAGSLLVFVLSVSAFATPKLIGGARTKVMATIVYDQATAVLNWPFAAACSFILIALVLGLTILQGRLLAATRAWVK
jgi:putative spermidine/putrescine transport system permease protein